MIISPSLFSYAPFNRSMVAAFTRPSASPSATDSLDQMFSGLGRTLNSLPDRQAAVAQIKTELAKLHKLLRASDTPGEYAAARPDRRPVTKVIEQTVEKPIYSTQDVFSSQPVYETRDVYGSRDIYETRPVYEQQDILETAVTGTSQLTSYSSIKSANISNGSTFTVQVGSGPRATIEFKSSTQIQVTTNGASNVFSYNTKDGSWRTALVAALNSISGMNASLTSNGMLELQTTDAQSLTIGAVSGSTSPLSNLGVTAGTTQSSVVGTRQVQVGTEEVVVGQEQYVTGQEQVQTGTQQVKTGSVEIQTGTSQVSKGSRSIVVGYDRVPHTISDPAASEEVRRSIKTLTSTIGTLIKASSGISGDSYAIAHLSTLSESADFKSLADAPDSDVLRRVVGKIDDALSQMKKTGAGISARRNLLAATSIGALLINGMETSTAAPAGLAHRTADYLRSSPVGAIREQEWWA